MIIPMVLSGGSMDLGGLSRSWAPTTCVSRGFRGNGWNGIAVALIAKNDPKAVIPAALFFAYLEAGAKAAMLHSDVTFEIASIVQSVIFYLVTAQALYGLFAERKKVQA
jgi:simple sugar transport system permease protein